MYKFRIVKATANTREYSMRRSILIICAVSLLAFCGASVADRRAFEYHHDAVMQLHTGALLSGARGYVYVATDMKGHGVIQVMFSNATPLDNALFNAQLKFFDASGGLVREEWFSRRVAAADHDGAVEDRLSRLVNLDEFDTLRVELYLSDIPLIEETLQFAAPAYPLTRLPGI